MAIQLSGSLAITGSLVATSQIVAQTLNVQQVTSSIVYSSGSNIFGNSVSNTQQFTGSLQVSGSTSYILGNVGIGTTSPSSILEVSKMGAQTASIFINQTDANEATIRFKSTHGSDSDYRVGASILVNSAFEIYSVAAASTRFIVTNSGSVGIGTTSPAEKLDVIGGAVAAGNGTIRTGITYSSLGLIGTFTNHDLGVITNGTERMRITSGGNVGIGNTNPVQKLSVAGSYVRMESLSTDNTNAGTFFRVLNGATTVGQSTQAVLNNGDYIITTGTSSEAERMRITAAGNVGIGTTSPATLFYVNGYTASNWITTLNNTGTSGHQMYFGYNDGSTTQYGLYIAGGQGSGASNFDLAVANKFYVMSGGNVGIGTTSPTEKLDVRGNIYTNATNTNIYLDNGGAGGASLKIGVTGSTSTYINSLDAHPILFLTTNTERMRITSDGRVGVGTTDVDAKFKIFSNSEANLMLSTTTKSSVNIVAQVQAIGLADLDIEANNIKLFTGTVERMRITSGGLVNILSTSTNTTFTSGGTLGIKNSAGDPYISWHANDGSRIGYLQMQGSGLAGLSVDVNQPLAFYTNAQERMRITSSGTVQPGANGTQDLGTSSLRWATVYTSDLDMSNGIGDYTIVEGEEDLFLYNNKTNKVFKFVIQEVDPSTAPPKKVK